MTPFPHFPYLPPATPAQAAHILAQLHVTPRMVRFDRQTSALAILADLYVLLLFWILLASRLAARMRDLAERWFPRSVYLQGVVVFALADLFLAVCGLPLSLTRGWIVFRDYGLTHEPFGQWMGDHVKAVGVNLLVSSLIAGLLLVIVRRFPLRWPYGFAAALTPLIAFGIFLAPVLVDPLFNQFTLLSPSTPIYTQLHGLAERAGIGDAKIYIVDKSKQTDETNAYVTGFGPSLRIVIWDTTLKRLTPREVVAITGHEMGHYVEGHLIIGFALSVIGLFVGFPLIRWFAAFWLARSGPRWGLRPELHDPAALVLLWLCLQIALLVQQPIYNVCSRWIEHRADAYSLGLVRDRVGLAQSFVDMSKQDLEDPYPPFWEKIWFDDHPPVGERIEYSLYGQPE